MIYTTKAHTTTMMEASDQRISLLAELVSLGSGDGPGVGDGSGGGVGLGFGVGDGVGGGGLGDGVGFGLSPHVSCKYLSTALPCVLWSRKSIWPFVSAKY